VKRTRTRCLADGGCRRGDGGQMNACTRQRRSSWSACAPVPGITPCSGLAALHLRCVSCWPGDQRGAARLPPARYARRRGCSEYRRKNEPQGIERHNVALHCMFADPPRNTGLKGWPAAGAPTNLYASCSRLTGWATRRPVQISHTHRSPAAERITASMSSPSAAACRWS